MEKRTIIFLISVTFALFAVKLGFNYYNAKTQEEWLKAHPEAAQEAPQEKKKVETPVVEVLDKAQDKYYVLENDYQQLVFSSRGGALVEINLPFKSALNTKSVVLPVEFDRELLQQSPANEQFPLFPAQTASGKTTTGTTGGYYPLLRRDQLLSNSTSPIPARYYGFNIVSEYPELADLNYKVKKFTENEIVFEANQSFRRITKRFYFPDSPDSTPYCFHLEITIDGDKRGLFLTSGVPEVEWISGSPGSVIKYHYFRGNSSKVEKIDLPKEVFNLTSVTPDWVCNSNGFFGLIIDPLKGAEAGFRASYIKGEDVPSRLHLIDLSYNYFPLKDLPGYSIELPINQTSTPLTYRLFAGPFDDVLLKKIDAHYLQEQGGKESDYAACQTFHGWFAFISEPFAKFLFFLMKFFHSIIGSWGLSIILITIVLRILLYPLNSWSLRSMKAMQQVAPHLKAIQERYKNDKQKLQQETLRVYREYGVNPLSGCFPLLIQMPFLIGMFDLLKSSFELRGASFIPGWIDDLSSPDVLFSWTYPIPFIGNEFHLLPFILGGIMFVQQNLMSNLPKDPAQWTDQQRQQRSMGTVMTIVLTAMFYQFPSGLNIYWISSMLLSIGQQWYTTRSSSTPGQNKPLQTPAQFGKKK